MRGLLPGESPGSGERRMNSNNSASLNATPSVRGGPIRWLILGGALLIAAIAVGATVMAGNFRERALNNAERELENTVLLLARHFDQQLEDFEVVQKDLIDYMRVERHRHAGELQAPDVERGDPSDAEVQDERACPMSAASMSSTPTAS